MTEDQIKHMVERFLAWRLPDNFRPDNGVSFEQVIYPGMSEENQAAHWPVGTNLLDYTQAEEMVRHMVANSPSQVSAVGVEELRDIFERPFDGEDDPRIQVARVLTRTEAQAVLEHRGDIVAALSVLPSPGGWRDDMENAPKENEMRIWTGYGPGASETYPNGRAKVNFWDDADLDEGEEAAWNSPGPWTHWMPYLAPSPPQGGEGS